MARSPELMMGVESGYFQLSIRDVDGTEAKSTEDAREARLGQGDTARKIRRDFGIDGRLSAREIRWRRSQALISLCEAIHE
jgi:uncharacterized protein (DUF2235 family)